MVTATGAPGSEKFTKTFEVKETLISCKDQDLNDEC